DLKKSLTSTFLRLVLNDVSRNRGRRHRERACQIHLTWAATSGKIAVLRANNDLIASRRNPRTGIDTGSATRLNDVRPGPLEQVQIALAHTVVARFLRSELDVELNGIGDSLAILQCIRKHPSVHIHVLVLSGGAGSTVGKLDGNRSIQLADVLAITGI